MPNGIYKANMPIITLKCLDFNNLNIQLQIYVDAQSVDTQDTLGELRPYN